MSVKTRNVVSAIANYESAANDELTLSVGDKIYIINSYDDGWVLGRNSVTNEIGFVPANFLHRNPDSTDSSSNSKPRATTATPVHHDMTINSHHEGEDESGSIGFLPEPLSPLERHSSLVPLTPEIMQEFLDVDAHTEHSHGELGTAKSGKSELLMPQLKIFERTLSLIQPTSESMQSDMNTQPVVPVDYKPPVKLPRTDSLGLPPRMVKQKSVPPFFTVFSRKKDIRLNTDSINSSRQLIPNSQTRPYLTGLKLNENESKISIVSESSFSPSLRGYQMQTNSPDLEPLSLEVRLEQAKQKLMLDFEVKSQRAPTASNIGTFKIAVVGDSGIGKTSLIDRFLSVSEIVTKEDFDSYNDFIRVIQASTIAEGQARPDEQIMNLVFIDTPGFGSQVNALDTIQPVVEYHSSQFRLTDEYFSHDTTAINNQKLKRFLNAGNGAHTHVEVVLYGILHRIKPVDIEYMRNLTEYASIVPVIVKCDTLSKEEIFRIKVSVLMEMKKCDIPVYGFGLSYSDLVDLANAEILGAPPYAVTMGGSKVSEWDEFHHMKQNLLYNHTADLRRINSELFVSWRENSISSLTRNRSYSFHQSPVKATPDYTTASSSPTINIKSSPIAEQQNPATLLTRHQSHKVPGRQKQIRGFFNRLIRSSSTPPSFSQKLQSQSHPNLASTNRTPTSATSAPLFYDPALNPTTLVNLTDQPQQGNRGIVFEMVPSQSSSSIPPSYQIHAVPPVVNMGASSGGVYWPMSGNVVTAGTSKNVERESSNGSRGKKVGYSNKSNRDTMS
ncbi:hypothetical protein HK098_007665 [Nowakowskiella sp. JEL0407]|nr:hypothetical protein HK098_007665 [Nowakowskiella sp. JEL0407]